MDDTTPDIAEKIREMFRMKSPVELFKIGCSMYQTSRYLVTRAILEETPDISETGLKQQLFLRFYGQDYDKSERERILNYLARESSL